MNWNDSIEWEKNWWGNCQNTIYEELKQIIYAVKMGLRFTPDEKTPYRIDLQGKSVLDIGGGPCSLLLKCYNGSKLTVIDPLKYPTWVYRRYFECGIALIEKKGEDIEAVNYDEVWIYNCLQHTEDPEKVIQQAKKAGKVIRIFEWIGTSASNGHLQILTEQRLNDMLCGNGKVEIFTGENGLKGKAFFGIFKGENES